MKSFLVYLSFTLAFVSILAVSSLPTIAKETTTNNPIGKVLISVLDEKEHTPILNASICIIETREYYETNKLGQTDVISLPAKSSNTLNATPPTKAHETYTLLIYKNGYFPHIYYGLKIENNITKTGVVISLTERYPEADFTYTESYEFPTPTWSQELIDKYRK